MINMEQSWVEKLIPGNRVWLVKEAKEAIVESIFWFSSFRYGYIKLKIDGNIYKWQIRTDGSGDDYKPLLSPIDLLSDEEYIEYFMNKYKVGISDIDNAIIYSNKYGGTDGDAFSYIRYWIAEEHCIAETGFLYYIINY